MKTEPTTFSFDDLLRAPRKTTGWDGVRNYQARNFLREMKKGDTVFIYHSNTGPKAVVGIAAVVCEAYSDPTQFDPKDDHHDPGLSPADARWSQGHARAVGGLAHARCLVRLWMGR